MPVLVPKVNILALNRSQDFTAVSQAFSLSRHGYNCVSQTKEEMNLETYMLQYVWYRRTHVSRFAVLHSSRTSSALKPSFSTSGFIARASKL